MKERQKPRNDLRSRSERARTERSIGVEAAGERIQKVLARLGVGSRREIEGLIRQGRIALNGQPVTLGERCLATDRISLNGRVIDMGKRVRERTRVLLYHKPLGVVVSRHDPEGRPLIFSYLPRLSTGRWVAVGRLDINTQGLLIVTNNGELANRLMHPAGQMERRYAVRVLGEITSAVLDRLTHGVELEDGRARFERIEPAGGEGVNRWFHVTLREGRNRIVRRLFESQGYAVSRLIRIGFGEASLPPGLRAGAWVELDPAKVARLMASVALEPDRLNEPRSVSRRSRPGQRSEST